MVSIIRNGMQFGKSFLCAGVQTLLVMNLKQAFVKVKLANFCNNIQVFFKENHTAFLDDTSFSYFL